MIAALRERYGLSAEQAGRLQRLAEFVASDPAAPTTVTTLPAVLRDHVADSLVALELEAVRAATAIADLGSGAGFPGLPLAIASPSAQVSLVESTGRKCEFIARAAEVSEARNTEVVHARVEEWAPRTPCDLVVARALAPLAVVAEYAGPLLRVGGTLLAWRGQRDLDDEERGARAAAELGLEPGEPIAVHPYPGARHRHLHPLVKARPTPERFPRRPGMARKRPLG